MDENSALISEGATMYTQTEALKEAKDLSVNLMSGDFERQYKDGILEKNVKRRRHCVIVGVSLGALAIWLLVLTIVREMQISRLRQEVEQLTVSMIAMSANVMTLNQKCANNRFLNDLITLEDTMYADDVENNSERSKENTESLNKLHGLTVLEGEGEIDRSDDEDIYDGENDEESGDWYPDYDKHREKIGTTNMVRLKPEDFTQTVIGTFEKVRGKAPSANAVKQLENDSPDIEDIDQSTLFSPTEESTRDKRSVVSDATPNSVTEFLSPRAVSKEERRKTKKFVPSSASDKAALHTISRMARNSNDEDGVRRPFIAAHFHGNTSQLSTGIHEHYKGNGLVRVAHGAHHDVWSPAPWTAASPHPRPTLTRNGHVHVHHSGVYLVYVQIYYLDSHDIISWVLHRTNAEIEGRETLLQCAQSSHSSEPLDKPNSCFSAAALFLKAGDRLAVRNTGGDRHSLMQPEKSFIGLVKLADADLPDDEF
ncbi:uncharacterized protein egr [Epargyreus clarus]|uniref:uncharacterized protein egr n=1 Tax=Epargyreus clarus TaxID=520877 RepID=UPI003C2BDDA2